MDLIILHGLVQIDESWIEVKELIVDSYDIKIPKIFDMIESPISYEKLYNGIESYLNNLNDRFDLCGLSLGGILALNYAFNNPNKINSLILIGVPYEVPKELIIKQNEAFNQMPEELFLSLGLSKNDFMNIINTTFAVDIPKLVDGIKCNTLVLCGEKDVANLESAQIIHSKIINSELKIIKDSGHVVNSDNPEELAKIIKEFSCK